MWVLWVPLAEPSLLILFFLVASVQFRIVSMDINFIPVNRVVSVPLLCVCVCVFTGWLWRALRCRACV